MLSCVLKNLQYCKYGTYYVFKTFYHEFYCKNRPIWTFLEKCNPVKVRFNVLKWIIWTILTTKMRQSWYKYPSELRKKFQVKVCINCCNVCQRGFLIFCSSLAFFQFPPNNFFWPTARPGSEFSTNFPSNSHTGNIWVFKSSLALSFPIIWFRFWGWRFTYICCCMALIL